MLKQTRIGVRGVQKYNKGGYTGKKGKWRIEKGND